MTDLAHLTYKTAVQDVVCGCISTTTPPGGGGGGEGRGGDTCRLALGCKLQILVSQGVWDGRSLYLPIQVSLGTVHKEINVQKTP